MGHAPSQPIHVSMSRTPASNRFIFMVFINILHPIRMINQIQTHRPFCAGLTPFSIMPGIQAHISIRLHYTSICRICQTNFMFHLYFCAHKQLHASLLVILLCHRQKKTGMACAMPGKALFFGDQYIPPISGEAGAAGGVGSLMSATRDSVVSTMEATEAAFCRAERVTFVGSTTPASNISTYPSEAKL